LAEDPRHVLQRNRVLLEAAEREQLLEKLPQGHGSGLDADTVDGLHAAEIISKRQAQAFPVGSGVGTAVHGNQKHSPVMAEAVHTHVESEITDLNHDAQKIRGKTVDPNDIGDGKVLAYDQPSDKIVYKDPSAGGMEVHGNEFHEPEMATAAQLSLHESKTTSVHNFDGLGKASPQSHSHPCSELTDHDKAKHDALQLDAASLEGSSKAEVQDHAPQIHGNEVHDPDMATVNELSTHASNPDSHHSKFTPTEHDVTARHTLGTVVPHDALASLTEKSHESLSDKGTNTHTQIDTHIGASSPHSGHEATANKGAANGYAPLDANQKVPTVNLGGAGADNTKFLRGDQTWQVPSGGGEAENVVVLGGDQTTNSTSFVDLPGLSFPVEANSTYIIEAWIVWQSSSASYGIGFAVNGPANQVLAAHKTLVALTTATEYIMNGTGYNAPNATSASPPAANQNYLALMHAVLKTGGTAGNFQVRWRSENSSGTMTAKAGSSLRWRKIA
jgi:hypothetical protein